MIASFLLCGRGRLTPWRRPIVVDSSGFSCYLGKVRKNAACGVSMARMRGRKPLNSGVRGVVPGPGEFCRPDKLPGSLSSCGGQGAIASEPARSPPEGLCGPEPAIRRWLFRQICGKRPANRRGSRLIVERRQTRSSHQGPSVCLCGRNSAQRQGQPASRVCGCGLDRYGLLKGKELLIADF